MPSPLGLLDPAGRHRVPMVMQSEATECGLACLAMIAGFHGHRTDLNALRRRFAISAKGITLRTLLAMAGRLGLGGRGLRLEPEALGEIRLPAILHWDMNHFVVLTAIGRGRATIHDPARGVRRLAIEELGRHFTGIVLELTPTPGFRRIKEAARLTFGQLCGRVAGLGGAVAQALAFSLILQLFVLASPFYLQLAVDEAVLHGDTGLLGALAVGFGLLTAIKLAADWLRARVLLTFAAVVNVQMVANLFHHLLRLPLDWFEKRHIGDLVSRFGSTRPITDLLSQGLIAAVVDGAMAVLTLVMIVLYSPTLAAIVAAALVLQSILRLSALHLLRGREEAAIHAEAREQTIFIETARAIQSLKLFGREADREAQWQNRQAEAVNARTALGRAQEGLRIGKDLLGGIENVLVIWLGARMAIEGDLTVGMLFAFMSYKQQFLDKASRLVETAVQLRLLDLHLQRLADIALAEPERESEEVPLVDRPLAGAITLRGVRHRYGEADPEVLAGVDIEIEPGAFVAITGPSGGGKTTLLKIMLGLLRPTAGEVLVDGRRLDGAALASFRAQVGAVMQDDQLLSGSIAENICFFDPASDLAWMRACAETAGLDAEVMAMPMNYNTLVGDLGSGLSGGQRQRVLLARALYRRPRILMMDEGTSHLDVAKEREVNRALAALRITRVVIAHRPETIAAADRVVVLADGRLETAPSPQRPVLVAAEEEPPGGQVPRRGVASTLAAS